MFPMCYDYPSESRCLKKLESIAVWNRDKIVLAISMAIWIADIALLIHGKYLLQIMGECFVNVVI